MSESSVADLFRELFVDTGSSAAVKATELKILNFLSVQDPRFADILLRTPSMMTAVAHIAHISVENIGVRSCLLPNLA
ncbi:MAG: hypothetical protein OQL16_07015 [Gammaproteobacteria bacterium]|nr:hypothetical protein [Gammaproteobacteria bacterium]